MSNLAIAILAAGASSRMGQPKQLLLFRGKTLVQHAVDIAVATGSSSIYLIVNPLERLVIQQTLKQSEDEFVGRFTFLINESYVDGISTSIRLATTIVSAQPDFDGLLFLNCDQPFLTASELLQLMASYEKGKIVASSFDGTIGSPAIFDRTFFHELLQLSGDVGAKSIIKQHRDHVVICEITEGQFDVDTPADYQALIAMSEKAAT